MFDLNPDNLGLYQVFLILCRQFLCDQPERINHVNQCHQSLVTAEILSFVLSPDNLELQLVFQLSCRLPGLMELGVVVLWELKRLDQVFVFGHLGMVCIFQVILNLDTFGVQLLFVVVVHLRYTDHCYEFHHDTHSLILVLEVNLIDIHFHD